MNDEILEVLCFNFPDGTTYWAERANLDAEAVVSAWKESLDDAQRERYLRSDVFGGFVVVRMPRDDYHAIPSTSKSNAIFIAVRV